MPTPLQVLIDPVSLMLLGLYAVLFAIEVAFPARQQPLAKGWHFRAIFCLIGYFYLASYLPLIWDQYLVEYQIFDLTGLNNWVSTLIALLVFQFLLYCWHRSMHQTNWLWCTFHQMHHSAERVDLVGAFYFSPLDMVGFTLLGSISLVVVIGITPQAATNFLVISQFMAVFQHCNIRTPQVLGYFIQRPESHSIHHGKGIHGYNYSDLPLIDIMFGTFRNPKYYDVEVGFYHGASSRVLEMLSWKDVSKENPK